MALTITKVAEADFGELQLRINTVLFDASYPGGGEPVTGRDLGHRMGRLYHALAPEVGNRLVTFALDSGINNAGKLKVHDGAAGCFTAPGLAIGSVSKAKVLIANTVTFTLPGSGTFKSKTTAEVPFTATTDDIAASAAEARQAWYVLSLLADGTPALTKGTETGGTTEPVIPQAPAGQTAIGAVKVSVAAASTLFDATTDALDRAGLTATYRDLQSVPSQASEPLATTDLTGFQVTLISIGQ